jgi:ribosomal protein S18 acetylase RimI-like enzyme
VTAETCEIRRLQSADAGALAEFYNTLSARSIRLFRPLGTSTSREVCEGIALENGAGADTRHDIVALADSRIVGWAFLCGLGSGEPAFGIGVADAHQGAGIGSRLIDLVMRAARERGLPLVVLTVVQDNDTARRMYERRGFIICGEFVGETDGLPYHRMEWRPLSCIRDPA